MERTVRERTAELQRFRGAMDATADAIFLVDAASMPMVDVSDGACRMLGFSRERCCASIRWRWAWPSGPSWNATGRCHGRRRPREHDMIETELLRADGQGAVPVEISWQLQQRTEHAHADRRWRATSANAFTGRALKHMSNYDSLTGLPNRTLFFQTLRDAIELAQDKNWRIAVLFITLDRFKIVNDSLGPAAGRRAAAPVQHAPGALRAPARHRRAPGRRRVRADPDHDARAARTRSTSPTKCARRCARRST
jgi:PAS domain-containing protein